MGFGLTQENGFVSDVLLETQVDYVEHDDCQTLLGPDVLLNRTAMLCAYGGTSDAYVEPFCPALSFVCLALIYCLFQSSGISHCILHTNLKQSTFCCFALLSST